MTTNHKETLHRSLTRSGRVDREIEFTVADEKQMELLFLKFYPDDMDSAKSICKKKLQEQKSFTC
eukprot:UN03865